MADLKISQLTAITTLTPATDVLPVVDVTGTTKKITTNQLLGSGGTATLASATITGDLTVDTNVLKVDALNNRVGVNTATPSYPLHVLTNGVSGRFNLSNIDRTTANWARITNPQYATDASAGLILRPFPDSDLRQGAGIIASGGTNNGDTNVALFVSSGVASSTSFAAYATTIAGAAVSHDWYQSAGSTSMTLNATGLNIANGNVILGTSGKGIDFSATASGSGTMTSELLNDYEEGTWTIGLTFGGGNTGLTTVLNTGRYTKIGRQVTVCGRLELSNKGSSTGAAVITGLPFSIANTNDAQQAASFRCNGVSYTGAFQGYGTAGSTTIPLEQISEAGSNTNLTDSNFVNGTSIQISLTYTI